MKIFLRNLLLAVAGIFLAACDAPRTDSVAEPLQLPAGADSFAPRLFNVHGRISLSWLEADGSGHVLRYATWEDGKWSAAQTVAKGDDWFANWADLPGVRPLGDGRWLAWWLQKSGEATYAYDVRLALSDDGRTWRGTGTPHHDGTLTEHGFVSVFDVAGGFALAWLDGRNTAPSAGHHGGHGGGMTLRYGMFDGTGSQVADVQLDGLVCDCCQTDAAAIPGGAIVVYRDRTEAEIRDIHAIRYVNDEWSDPVSVNADGWKIDACPVNGPAVAASGNDVAVAWFTASGGEPKVQVAFSHDGGRLFSSPVRVDNGRPLGRVDIVLQPESGAWVSWMEAGDGGAQLRLRAVDSQGEINEGISVTAMHRSRAAGFPRMTLLDDGRLLFAWTEAGESGRRVQTAFVNPPD